MFVIIFIFNGKLVGTDITYESAPSLGTSIKITDVVYSVVNRDIISKPTHEVELVVCYLAECVQSSLDDGGVVWNVQ